MILQTTTLLATLVILTKNGTCQDSTTTDEIQTTESLESFDWGSPGLYGGSYYNTKLQNPNNIHWIHGAYQQIPAWYYSTLDFNGTAASDGTFDYYVGYGLSKISDPMFSYKGFHHYHHSLNRTLLPNERIYSDQIIGCHPTATLICPENTEPLCLFNGTIYCISKLSVVVPCDNASMECIATAVPCVRNCSKSVSNLEMVLVPCLARVIIFDVYEDQLGTSIVRVGNTFVLVPATPEDERTFCVTVIVDPEKSIKQSAT